MGYNDGLPAVKIPALLLLACSGWAQSVRLDFEQLQPPLIQQRLEALSRNVSKRRATLEALFREGGCDGANLFTQKVPGSKEPNIVCTLPGATDAPVIVVGGHFDLVEAGEGAVDDWSGAVLLPSLYQSLKHSPRRHTYVFVAFAAEETGLNGSHEYVKRLSKEQKASVHAMINLECLGLAPPKVWASRADKHLLEGYARVAKALGMEAQASNVDQVGDDDSHPFLSVKIPVLTVHSVTTENLGILHSVRDQVSAVRPGDYYATYRMVAAYLAYLDGWVE
jgi:nucleotide-binding universal stress UspA family protein